MQNLFYTPLDKRLFWIAGYTADGNTNSVAQMCESLQDNAKKFAAVAGCDWEEVQTHYNDRPPRYQYMRIFFITTETPHKDAFICNAENGWTMDKWITY